MKKNAVILILAAGALLLSGCAQQNNSGAAASATTTTTAAETTTTVSEAPAETTAALTAPDVSGQERLFGGSVNSDDAVDIYIAPDESSEAVATIPGWTQIEVYESGESGWYITVFDGKTGYIKADLVSEIPSYDMDYVPSVSDIAGRWIYEQQDASYTEGYRGVPVGLFTVAEDGTFTYTTDGESFTGGTVAVTYEEYIDGSKVAWFSFYDESGNQFMACAAIAPDQRTDGCLYVGQDGIERLVPDNGNAVAGTDNAAAPNEYGFYEYKNPPESGVSVAALSGTWYDESNNGKVVITSDSDLYSGSFTATDSEGNSASGSVKLEYTLNPDNAQEFWYTFYFDNGSLWNAFGVSGDIPLEDLYSGQDGAVHLKRVEE